MEEKNIREKNKDWRTMKTFNVHYDPSKASPLDSLPLELKIVIASFLSLHDLAQSFRLNKAAHVFSDSELLWSYLFKQHDSDTYKEVNLSWKERYRYLLTSRWAEAYNAKSPSYVISNGGLTVITTKRSNDSATAVRTIIGFSKGKHYWEINIDEFPYLSAPYIMIGVSPRHINISLYVGGVNNGISFTSEGTLAFGSQTISHTSRVYSFASKDQIGVYLDMDNKEIEFYKNGKLVKFPPVANQKQIIDDLFKQKELYPSLSLPGSPEHVRVTANFKALLKRGDEIIGFHGVIKWSQNS